MDSSKGRVLLLNPNTIKPAVYPMALDYLGDALINHGFDFDILDLCFEKNLKESIQNHLTNSQYLAVGITFRNLDNAAFPGTEFFVPDLEHIVQTIKSYTHQVPIILGGCGFSSAPKEILQRCELNLGVVGDGDIAFPALLKRLLDGQSVFDIPGVIHRDIPSGDFHFISPSYMDQFQRSKYNISITKRNLDLVKKYFEASGIAGVVTKRGCNQECTYCVDPEVAGKSIRLRSPSEVVDELMTLLAIGIDRFFICDSEFNIPEYHALEICHEIEHRKLGNKIRWYCYLTPATFTKDLAVSLRSAGCAGVIFCTESGSNKMLRILGKGFNQTMIKEASQLCIENKIPFLHTLMLGSPGETKETVRQSIVFMQELNPTLVKVGVGVRIYPGTTLAHQLLIRGLEFFRQSLRGAIDDNNSLLKPVFFIDEQLGPEIDDFIRESIGQDERFIFFPTNDENSEPTYRYDWMKLEHI